MKLAIDSAAEVLRNGIVGYAVRRLSLESSHKLHEGTPLSIIARNPRAQKQVVLLNSLPVKAAGVDHDPKKRITRKRHIFGRRVPAAKCIPIYHVYGIRLGNSNINISTRNELSS